MALLFVNTRPTGVTLPASTNRGLEPVSSPSNCSIPFCFRGGHREIAQRVASVAGHHPSVSHRSMRSPHLSLSLVLVVVGARGETTPRSPNEWLKKGASAPFCPLFLFFCVHYFVGLFSPNEIDPDAK